MIIQKYGTLDDIAIAHAALLGDVSTYDTDVMPTLEECTDGYDDTEVSVPFTWVALSSSLAHGRDLSPFLVMNSTFSINLATATWPVTAPPCLA